MGKLNVINGEIRTLVYLMKYYNLPAYRLQYIIFRTFNKLRLFSIFRPIYSKKEQKNKGRIIEFVIRKRFSKDEKNPFLNALIKFYSNHIEREIIIEDIIDEKNVYQGKDNAKFNKAIVNNNLPEIYKRLIKEMEIGFNTVIVKNNEEKKKITDILRFLCIGPFVSIYVKNNERI